MVTLAELRERVSVRRDAYNRRVGQRDALLDQIKHTEAELTRLEREAQLNEQVRYLLHKTSEVAREAARRSLEDTVTSALQYVFGPEYRFVIEITQKAGRTEAEFYVESPAPDSNERMRLKPEEARGGGVVDIVGLALRLAVLCINQDPKVAGVLILDEPAKMVSRSNGYSKLTADFLKWASSYFGVQVIMVTHNTDLAAVADKSFYVNQVNGTSILSEQPFDDGEELAALQNEPGEEVSE